MSFPDWMLTYLKRMHAEYVRIGFTEDELLVQAADKMPDEATFARELDDLAKIPSGIGARAYFEMRGFDYEPMRQAVEEFRAHRQR